MGRLKTARLERLERFGAVYSFRGPRSHRRRYVIVRYFRGDPVEGNRILIWLRDYAVHPERYFR